MKFALYSRFSRARPLISCLAVLFIFACGQNSRYVQERIIAGQQFAHYIQFPSFFYKRTYLILAGLRSLLVEICGRCCCLTLDPISRELGFYEDDCALCLDPQRAPQTSGILATAGGLIFTGSI